MLSYLQMRALVGVCGVGCTINLTFVITIKNSYISLTERHTSERKYSCALCYNTQKHMMLAYEHWVWQRYDKHGMFIAQERLCWQR
jgi:hypothetical protein